MEIRKGWKRMHDFKYDVDIQTYLAKLKEINSRVGATGEPFVTLPPFHCLICAFRVHPVFVRRSLSLGNWNSAQPALEMVNSI